jgi:hypothetical protein
VDAQGGRWEHAETYEAGNVESFTAAMQRALATPQEDVLARVMMARNRIDRERRNRHVAGARIGAVEMALGKSEVSAPDECC